jgi:hypothetical protein
MQFWGVLEALVEEAVVPQAHQQEGQEELAERLMEETAFLGQVK